MCVFCLVMFWIYFRVREKVKNAVDKSPITRVPLKIRVLLSLVFSQAIQRICRSRLETWRILRQEGR